jgi:hypothetical protein
MTGRPEGSDAPTTNERVQLRHDGHVVAAADISASANPHGTASVALRAPHELSSEAREELVDQVMEHPAVQGCDTVHVVVPLGDGASISRLHEHTTNANAHAAGASSIIDADVTHPAADD